MKKGLLILLFMPTVLMAQSKKKRQKAELQANAVMEASLKQHIQFLTSDSLEGRRAGSHGE
ncbi:hypothetical protein ACE400_29285, partial [Salmonella enterica]|uniref:hypothetical protein n=1 Tax=Salmonella enterica TaxID=28901 RepID=UPI003D2BFA50